MERAKRFELSTFSLATRCSTTELRPHSLPLIQPQIKHYPIQKLCQYAQFCLPFCLPQTCLYLVSNPMQGPLGVYPTIARQEDNVLGCK